MYAIVETRLAKPGLSSYAIAKELGCHPAHVRNTLRKAGLRLAAAAKHGKRLQDWEKVAVAQMYGDGEKMEVIAAEIGASLRTVQKIAHKAPLPCWKSGGAWA